MKVTKLSSLHADSKNVNRGTARGNAMIEQSFRDYGAGRSILLDRKGRVIAGNKSRIGAMKAGLKDVQIVQTDGTKVIAVQRMDLDLDRDKKARELAIVDNQAGAINLDFDLGILKSLDIDLGKFFTDEELTALEPETASTVTEDDPSELIDNAAELLKKWKVKPGQLWEIGALKHLLLCGDAKTDLPKLIGNCEVDLLLSDPPYGISIVQGKRIGSSQPQPVGFRKRADRGSKKPGFKGRVGGPGLVAARIYSSIVGDDEPFDPAPLLKIGKTQIIFGANHFSSRLPDSKCWIVWDKGVAETSTFSKCELAWSNFNGHVKMYRHVWSGLIREGSRDIELKDRVHPTQKPVGLFCQILTDFSKEGHVVCDPYLGSGSTMVACEQLKRRLLGSEISAEYCAVVLERMAALGVKGTLAK